MSSFLVGAVPAKCTDSLNVCFLPLFVLSDSIFAREVINNAIERIPFLNRRSDFLNEEEKSKFAGENIERHWEGKGSKEAIELTWKAILAQTRVK